MPARTEQEYESRRQQIIDGALHVFASKGFEKATNKDIARAAKIKSPGLIYHYFKDKSDLFRQVLHEHAEVLQLLSHTDELMGMPPRQALTLFATKLIKTLDDRAAIPLVKIMLGEALRRPAVADMMNRIGPARGIGFLTRYLAYQMEQGRLRKMDAGAAARCFAGPIFAYVITREIFVQPDSQDISSELMVSTLVDIFLQGMEIPGDT